MAIYTFISLAILANLLILCKYSRLCFKCYLNFKAVMEAIPILLLIYGVTVVYFICFTLLIQDSSISSNNSIYSTGMLFLNEFQMRCSNSLRLGTRSDNELFLLIPIYFFGFIILFTSMPFAFLL